MEWILASASPRRKELLGRLIDNFKIIPSLADEKLPPTAAAEFVKTLARKKAEEVVLRPENEGKTVVGADTVVVLDGKILGKPKDETDAFQMLSALSGRAHEVYTGVCFALFEGGKLICDVRADKTQVYFHSLTPRFIKEYIAGGSPMDKAGAYGIQDGGLVEKIEGSYTNVVGLPVELVEEMIKNWTKKEGRL